MVILHNSFACLILMFNLKIPVELDSFGLTTCGRSEEAQLRRESSQCIYGSWNNMLKCEGEGDCKIEEVGERELVLVVSVRCSKERNMTRG